eukprot:SAG11_NODE_344_length_10440_cov_10.595494_1_plen_121_part_00
MLQATIFLCLRRYRDREPVFFAQIALRGAKAGAPAELSQLSELHGGTEAARWKRQQTQWWGGAVATTTALIVTAAGRRRRWRRMEELHGAVAEMKEANRKQAAAQGKLEEGARKQAVLRG